MNDNYNNTVAEIRKRIKININYDISEKNMSIESKHISIFYVNSLVDKKIISKVCKTLLELDEKISKLNFTKLDIITIVKKDIEYLENRLEHDTNSVINEIYIGKIALVVEGEKEIIIIDAKNYPTRTPEESPNEISIRKSRDGFVEDINVNTALIRRRINDESLIIEKITVGKKSKVLIGICYIDSLADKNIVEKIKNQLSDSDINFLTITHKDVKRILFKNKLNTLPYSKTVETPEVLASELARGYIGLLVDNSPNTLVVPITFFDIITSLQQNEDTPIIRVASRILEILSFIIYSNLIPLWMYYSSNDHIVPEKLKFLFVSSEEYYLPVFFQTVVAIIIYKLLNLATFNAPKVLRATIILSATILLSSVGVEAKIIAPQVVFFVGLLALIINSVKTRELQTTIGTYVWIGLVVVFITGKLGLIALITLNILTLIFIATRKVYGIPYMYPLVPLNFNKLKRYFSIFAEYNTSSL